MAHKKGGSSTRNGRDSNSQRLGVKRFGGEEVLSGTIIVRQCGTKIEPGKNIGVGKDYTLFATTDGTVKFETLPSGKKRVHIVEAAPEAEEAPAAEAQPQA